MFVCFWRNSPQWPRASSFTKFLDHTQRSTTVGRTPLDELSARRRDLYLTTHNTHNRQTSIPPAGIRTHDLSRRAAADLRLRPRGHWDRLFACIRIQYLNTNQSQLSFIDHEINYSIPSIFNILNSCDVNIEPLKMRGQP